jgi:hypothetical protein
LWSLPRPATYVRAQASSEATDRHRQGTDLEPDRTAAARSQPSVDTHGATAGRRGPARSRPRIRDLDTCPFFRREGEGRLCPVGKGSSIGTIRWLLAQRY